LKTLAVGGVGDDLMGDLGAASACVSSASIRLDHAARERMEDVSCNRHHARRRLAPGTAHGGRDRQTSSLPMAMLPKVAGAKVFHAGGVGLMHAMDKGTHCRGDEGGEGRRRDRTTADIFASRATTCHAVASILPYTDLFPAVDRGGRALAGLAT
jgi:hypothetical protein